MAFIKHIVGLSFLLLSLNCQAGFDDLFCMGDSASCESNEIQRSEPQRMLKTVAPKPVGNICVDVKGSASTEGVEQEFARKMAIRDALKLASLKSNVSVHTDQSVEQYQMTLDSARFISASKVKSFKVLKEGLESAEDMYGQTKEGSLNYEVTLNVCLTEERGVCTSLTGNEYQARLAVAPVVMAHPGEARDISNLLLGYQQELERRINDKGYQNFTLLKAPVELRPNVMVAPNLSPEVLDGVRDSTGAQYLLLSVIRSLSLHSDNGYLNGAKRFYNLEVKPDSRFLEVDWYMVDLMKKRVVHQHRGGFDVKGEVTVGRNKPFGTNAFFSTNTGMAFHALLDQQVNNTLDFLHCKPFESQVIDVRGGQYVIYLNSASGAKVGDDLAVYHKTGRPIRYNGIDLGSNELPGAFLKIKRIMPKFAVAELTAKKGIVQVGDIVKAW
ncbi:MAG: hypothetical protein GXO35_06055 [Gammaproteobacteria bacterium]|nr:hypothetical protein [Gammaproteobacteria bacterium]